jgi:hypothetical protein
MVEVRTCLHFNIRNQSRLTPDKLKFVVTFIPFGIVIFKSIMNNIEKATNSNEKSGHKNLILYDGFEKKNALENKMKSILSPEESLIHTLNLMDFMVALQKKDTPTADEKIEWIVLELAKR